MRKVFSSLFPALLAFLLASPFLFAGTETLTELRTSLFFTFRAIRHAGGNTTEEDMEKIRNRVIDIRMKVEAGERE